MRPLVALLAFPLVALSGCVSSIDGSPDLDCSSSVNQAVAVYRSMLLPKEPVDTPYDEAGNRITVHARAGQDILAQAVWSVAAGEAEASFDGPSSHLVSTEQTWTVTAYGVPEGDYTLEVAGAPFAFEAVFTLQLIASGCTPT